MIWVDVGGCGVPAALQEKLRYECRANRLEWEEVVPLSLAAFRRDALDPVTLALTLATQANRHRGSYLQARQGRH